VTCVNARRAPESQRFAAAKTLLAHTRFNPLLAHAKAAGVIQTRW
jgi:hypothetical protein